MNWQDRSYSSQDEYGAESHSGRARSWISGLPSSGRAVKWIIFSNVIIFVLCQVTGGERSLIYNWLVMSPGDVWHGQVWRLLTYAYLHDQLGLGHILMNMLGLYFLGTPLERHWGSKRFLIFYTIGTFVAVLLYFLLTVVGWLPPALLVGASGGVLAVLGACAVLFPQIQIILLFFPVPIRPAALLFVVLYAFNLLNRGYNAGGDACHLAGMVLGIAWGYLGTAWFERYWNNRRAASRQRSLNTERQHLAELEAEVDQILDKVHRQGIGSLSHREKRLLEQATRQRQEWERRR